MEWIFAGLAFGFLGSFHCIGMCGPLALSLPQKSAEKLYFLGSRAAYNIGRVITYTLLGGAVGLLSTMISISGYQQGLSIGVGILLLLTLAWKNIRVILTKLESYSFSLIGKITGNMKNLFGNGNIESLFLIGILNGFLPCGFVYLALTSALTLGTVSDSMFFMAGFGFGTIPAMLAVSLAGGLISAVWRQRLKNLSPYFIALVGIILILRGLNLGIPFLSPAL
ncbi:sulfite exporter TauE/SafE family protein [Fodinibius sp. Rm-B-1B1-1]|uniref:sulfite exporter TauE/SafE family protein n=1 Tax=Fodinibius alkaliphilus TaxID=3140241 RepID=UPI00315A0141